MNARSITFRVTEDEAALLLAFAKQTGRTQSDVLRDFIRSLAKKVGQS